MRTKILLLLLVAIFQLTGHLSDLQRSIQLSDDSLYRMDIECLRPADGVVEIPFETAADGLQYSASCGEEVRVVLPSIWKHDPAL